MSEVLPKSYFRNLLKLQIQQISPQEKQRASALINSQLQQIWQQLTSLRIIKTVALFAAMPRYEPCLQAFCYFLQQKKVDCLLPRCLPNKQLQFCIINEWQDLQVGSYGILEPPQLCPVIPAATIDLFIIPALGFDNSGVRLGKGAGYYDRYLPRRKTVSCLIGVGFNCQIIPDLPQDKHDIAMDLIVTEQQVIPHNLVLPG